MNATFTYAIRYWVQATCVSPMRTGNAANDMERILTTSTGQAMLQGASIAGAMKAWVKDPEKKELLFGSDENGEKESSVRITDALFDETVNAEFRPMVQIDAHTAAAKDKNKYDIALLPRDASCNFEIIWLGHRDAVYIKTDDEKKAITLSAEAAAAAINDCLSAIQSGEITFGAQRSNGFGRMNLTVKMREYDMTDPADRDAWLDERTDDTKSLELETRQPDGIVFDVEAHITSILIKASAPKREGKKSIQTHFSENGEPVLPGSSLKGAMRTHMQKIVPFLFPKEDASELITRLMGAMPMREQEIKAGKLNWTDAKLKEKPGTTVEVTRIRINRLTAGTIQKALITEQPIGGAWQWQIQVPADEKVGALLVLYALRDLGLGIYQLGGTKAVGRGTVDGITVGITEGEKQATLTVSEGKSTLEDAGGIVAGWETQMGGGEHDR